MPNLRAGRRNRQPLKKLLKLSHLRMAWSSSENAVTTIRPRPTRFSIAMSPVLSTNWACTAGLNLTPTKGAVSEI